MVPTDLRYTKDHEWVRVDGEEATIGITAYAADQLGDIVFVELPEAGRALEQFAAFGVVESVKAVSDLFAPVSGEVVEANGDARRPSRSSSTATRTTPAGCSGSGSPTPAQLDGLLDAGRLRRADRRRLTDPMPYGPHTADDRARMLAALGLDLGRPAVRGHPGRAARLARSTCPSPSRSSSSRRG